MVRIVIRGYAAVLRDEVVITDPTALRTLGGLVYDQDELFTDCLAPPGIAGVSDEERVLAGTLEPGGVISFSYCEGDALLTATTEYRSPRALTNPELRALVSYTMGQWSDGIGENLYQCPIHDEYDIMCLWSRDEVGYYCPTASVVGDYPTVEVISE